MLNVDFWNKEKKMFQTDMNSDLNSRLTWIE